jgi:hypothetical protein
MVRRSDQLGQSLADLPDFCFLNPIEEWQCERSICAKFSYRENGPFVFGPQIYRLQVNRCEVSANGDPAQFHLVDAS